MHVYELTVKRKTQTEFTIMILSRLPLKKKKLLSVKLIFNFIAIFVTQNASVRWTEYVTITVQKPTQRTITPNEY